MSSHIQHTGGSDPKQGQTKASQTKQATQGTQENSPGARNNSSRPVSKITRAPAIRQTATTAASAAVVMTST